MSTTYTRLALLSLPAGAMALRALRPSFRSILLPVRFIPVPLFQGLPYESPLWQIREVPVYVKPRARMWSAMQVQH